MNREEKLKCLEELGGIPEETYDALVRMLIPRVNQQAQDLRKALDSGDIEEASLIAHSIKGSAANLRITEVSEQAAAIRSLLREEKDVQTSLVRFDELKRAILKAAAENGLDSIE